MTAKCRMITASEAGRADQPLVTFQGVPLGDMKFAKMGMMLVTPGP